MTCGVWLSSFAIAYMLLGFAEATLFVKWFAPFYSGGGYSSEARDIMQILVAFLCKYISMGIVMTTTLLMECWHPGIAIKWILSRKEVTVSTHPALLYPYVIPSLVHGRLLLQTIAPPMTVRQHYRNQVFWLTLKLVEQCLKPIEFRQAG